MKKAIFFLSLAFLMGIVGCKEDDEPTLGDPPTEADAAFTYEESAGNPNIIEFTATNSSLTAKWDFGNNTTGEGTMVTGTYPSAGTYTVTLTVFNSGGSASSSQDIIIANDDPTLLDDPLYNLLTGGISGDGYKVWVIDSTRDGHMGLGPNPVGTAGDYPEWWSAAAMDKSATGLYDDQFKFTLQGFGFDQITNGDIYLRKEHEADFPGAYENKGDMTAPFADQMGESWTITKGEDDTTLTVSGNSFIGFYAGVQEYKIVRISENELFLRYEDTKNSDFHWYLRLVPEDYPINQGKTEYSLPIDFESEDPKFTTFGNSTYAIIDNPQSGGINTSNRVLETVHGNETWAGLFVNIDSKLDLTGADSTISVKIYAPATGTLKIKLENMDNTDESVERDVVVNTANQWIEVSAGFSTAEAGKYDRVVLFPGWDVSNAGTFYLDDISQK